MPSEPVKLETGETTYGLPIDWKARATAAESRVRALTSAIEDAINDLALFPVDSPYGPHAILAYLRTALGGTKA